MKKLKFKSAEEKRRYEENERNWQALQQKYAPKKVIDATSNKLQYSLNNPPGRDRLDLPSKVTAGGSTARRDSRVYSGTAMIGVGTMHKSNMVPIFRDQDAKDIASMRR